jgi:RimJ/RimL family protein N-acetyltransferase
MRLKPGQIVKVCKLKGHTFTLRAPRRSDLRQLTRFINSLIRENAMILMDTPMGIEAERKWLASVLEDIAKRKRIHLVVETEGKLVGSCEIRRYGGKERHVGSLGISILNGYRDMGLGSLLMKQIIALAKSEKYRLITLEVFAPNARAKHVYKKLGFRQVGRIPKKLFHKGKYLDSVMMARPL